MSHRDPLAGITRYWSADLDVRARFVALGGRLSRGAIDEIWTDDTYAAGELGLEGTTVVDVGASVGAFTVLAGRLGAEHVHAYEPHPGTCEVLRGNVWRNQLDDRVTVHEQAVIGCGDHPRGYGVLAGDGADARLLDGMPAPDPTTGGPELLVELAHVADVLGGLDAVVLKLDCEGAEREIVAALHAGGLLVRPGLRGLVMEFHGPRMPGQEHLDVAGWGLMVTQLAEFGRLRTIGRPEWGGLLWWTAY